MDEYQEIFVGAPVHRNSPGAGRDAVSRKRLGAPDDVDRSYRNLRIFVAPQGLLRVVYQHQTIWWWTNVLFLGSSIVTILGLALLTRLLREAGDRVFALLGLILFVFGTTLWCLQLAFRLSIDPWAAQEVARTGVVPNFYVPLSLWTQVFFVVYTILAFAALPLYGGSMLSSRVLPHWVGGLAIAYGLAGLGISAFTWDVPPFLHYVLPVLIGVLLLRRSPLAPGSQHEEEATAAQATTVG